MKTFLPPMSIRTSLYEELAQMASDCLAACRQTAADGTVIFRPDGSGHYDAIWTRDFAYMVEGAGALMDPKETLAAIDYLLAGQREDGVIPDRRLADGTCVYLVGPNKAPLSPLPPLDNAPFIIKALDAYAVRHHDHAAFLDRREQLYKAIDTIPLSEDNLVYIDPHHPRPEYGFTDCVAKSGSVFFGTMLYWEACQRLAKLCAWAEVHDEAHEWFERAEATWQRIHDFWDADFGMYRSASLDCSQIDLWGSAYACVIRVASKTTARHVAQNFINNWDQCVYNGQLRHLPVDEYWHKLLLDVPRDTYQNGGYWATPVGWLAQVLNLMDDAKARELIDTVAHEFREYGIHEWVSETTRQLPGYVASIANVLGACQPAKKLEQ